MAQGDYIYHTDITDLVTRLRSVYSTHDLTFPTAVDDATNNEYPTSGEITAIFNAFTSAYSEEHLASCVKWTIVTGELDVGSPILSSTLVNMTTSLVDMEAQTHYTRTVNTDQTTYTQSTNTAGTDYSRTVYYSYETTYSYSAYYSYTSTYSNSSNGKSCTQNTMRNASYSGNNQCNCHTVYSSDCAQTTNTAGTGYSNTRDTDGTGYVQSSNTAVATYSQTTYTAGTTYTES